MVGINRVLIRSFERGLRFHSGEFKGVLGAGRHWIVDLLGRKQIDVAGQEIMTADKVTLRLNVVLGERGLASRVVNLL